MNPVAKMGFVPRGIYNNETTYDFLDFVYYNGNTYVAKKLTVGNEPQENNEYWQIFAKGGIEDVGIQFEEATERQNIQSGEDAPTLFGKIKKWYADLKNVAFTGSYNDLTDQPTASDIGALPSEGGTVRGDLKVIANINANNIYPYESKSSSNAITLRKSLYGGGSAKIEKTSNSGIVGASPILAESDILNTIEEISANTNADKTAGALAVKAITASFKSSINQIFSNLSEKQLEFIPAEGIRNHSCVIKYIELPNNRIYFWFDGSIVINNQFIREDTIGYIDAPFDIINANSMIGYEDAASNVDAQTMIILSIRSNNRVITRGKIQPDVWVGFLTGSLGEKCII